MGKFIAGMGAFAIVWISITVLCIAAWIHHIVYCFQNEAWIRLIVLALLAPLGIVDGFGLWFGWWD